MSNQFSTDFDFGNVTIDLGGLSGSMNNDVLDISNYISTYTLNTSSSGSTFSVGAQGSTGNWNNTWYTTTTGFNGTSGTPSTVNMTHNGIEVKNGADIKIGHRSLSDFMDRVESRLGILQPDPELLEKFEALKQAYEHYKTLEALCVGNIPKDPNGK
jgi:hypothetical protein